MSALLVVVSIRVEASELLLSAPALATKVKDVVNSALDQVDSTTRAAVTSLASGLTLPGLPAYGSPVPDFLDFAFTADQLEDLSLANSPCDSGKTFECRKGGVAAVVNAKRRVVSLTFDQPLPTLAEHLATRTREAINCADEPAMDPEEDPIIPEVTGSPGLHTLVLYAKGLLKLNDRVKVKTAGCADWATVANAGFVETNIGVETDVGNILSRAKVFVRDRGRVHGFIRTSDVVETQNQTEIDGPVHENVGLVLPDLALNVTFPGTVDGQEPDRCRAAPQRRLR